MEYILPNEIWQLIINFCDSVSQIRFCQISKFVNANVHVTNLCGFKNLTRTIIRRYPFAPYFCLCYNIKVTPITGMISPKLAIKSIDNIKITAITGMIYLKLKI